MSSNITPDVFSDEVINYKLDNGDMTYLEALCEICSKHDVPFEDVCNFKTERTVVVSSLIAEANTEVKIDEEFNLITSNLKSKLSAECSKNGLLKGRTASLF